jgi:RNA polymerase sigma factor (sigma-70 family)
LAANAIAAGVAAPARSETAADARAQLLFERYYDRIFAYCLYKLGSREEAEDATQTTFMYVVSGLRRGIVPRAEANWVFTIALNACRARIRARGRRRARELPRDPHTLQELSPARAAEYEELAGLEDALASMPELQRRAILLREWRGLSYREIAEKLGLSGAAVETLIFRARRSLAERLEQPVTHQVRPLFSFGSLAATLKSALAGSVLKLAAAAAVATLVVGVPGDSARQPSKTQSPVDAPPVRAEPKPALEQMRSAVPREPLLTSRSTKPAAGTGGSAEPALVDATATTLAETVEETSASLPLVEDVVEAAPLDVVEDVEATVAAIVETAEATLETTLP